MTESHRGEERPLLQRATRGMMVLDAAGRRVGSVDKVEGGRLKIVRIDRDPPYHLQYVAPDWLAAVDEGVRLGLSFDEARERWTPEPYARRPCLQRSV